MPMFQFSVEAHSESIAVIQFPHLNMDIDATPIPPGFQSLPVGRGAIIGRRDKAKTAWRGIVQWKKAGGASKMRIESEWASMPDFNNLVHYASRQHRIRPALMLSGFAARLL